MENFDWSIVLGIIGIVTTIIIGISQVNKKIKKSNTMNSFNNNAKNNSTINVTYTNSYNVTQDKESEE